VNDVGEGTAIGLDDRGQRAVGGVAKAEQEGDAPIRREAEDRAGEVLVADGGVARADSEVGGDDPHYRAGLAEVELGDVARAPRGGGAR